MAIRPKNIVRDTKKGRRRAGGPRRGMVQRPFWRVPTVENEKRAREIEEDAAKPSYSTVRAKGYREMAQRIREGKLDIDHLVDYRHKDEMPKLTLCKIHPERFRAMDLPHLQRALFFMGEATKAERVSLKSPRGLTYNFVSNLVADRTDGERTTVYGKLACDYEKRIYDAQQKAGCPIASSDVAARDELRKMSCDMPYPQERLDKIRGRKRATISGVKPRRRK